MIAILGTSCHEPVVVASSGSPAARAALERHLPKILLLVERPYGQIALDQELGASLEEDGSPKAEACIVPALRRVEATIVGTETLIVAGGMVLAAAQ